ncbi:MAG: excinuclease ABC subunit C [Candidatus Pelagibacter sp. TMED197]|nr:excinuclease ABC subunit C [Candidatus Pelagibacter sp.]OUW59760.1 MAG: excinuclease ABC subunit C [Candidatus Pelagibacter sp. TMED197]
MDSLEQGKKIIKDKIPLISKNPGVYKMLSSTGEILYIGKAKNIPNRLKSYVTESNLPIRTERMLSLTHNLETTTTNNESEALLLEANLIKKYKPRYNILLRDDKSFPYIYIGNKDKWPQLTKLRGKKSKSGYYFGPFASIGSANWTIKILQKIFQLRVCDDAVFRNRERPCILYQIKRCSAPCVNHISEKEYLSTVNDAIDFISGKSRRIQKNLSKEMEKASKDLDYEKAALARDRIKALTQIQTSQRINQTNLNEADVISIYKETGKTCIQVFFFRSKQNWGNQAFYPKHDPEDTIQDILSSFISQFYENKSIPVLIITNHEVSEKTLLEKTFSNRENKQILIKQAKSKNEINISNLAEKNAKQALTQKLIQSDTNNNLIENLAKKFRLNNNIDLIEVYDNSHIQGSDSIGALICFGNEGFVKKRYRKFNIKDDKIKGDDYGMLKEVLFRRFSKAIKEKSGSLSLPDLVIIDGGKGQYSVSREILNELGLHDLPILSVAKGKKRNAGEEKIYYEKKEFILDKNDPLLFFIQRLRDEAHRFAISTHRSKRKKNLSKSLLDQIQGIGRQRKRALLNHFGSARAVESASFDDLKSVEGIEDSIAKKIYNYFHE